MQVRLLAAGLVMFALLAGCSSKTETPVLFVCPDNTSIDLNTVPGHDKPGFQSISACPVKPSIVITSGALTVPAYGSSSISWELRNGTFGTTADPAHSMLSQIRVSDTSVPQTSLKGPDSFGKPIASLTREHQNLPQKFTAPLNGFTTPGIKYVRAYMQVRAPGLDHGNETDQWSPEYKLNITAVLPTGKTVHVVRPLGPAGADGAPGGVNKSFVATVGDLIVFQNDDVNSHTFTFTEVPTGANVASGSKATVASMDLSEGFVLKVPGTYKLSIDEPGTLPADPGLGALAQLSEILVKAPA